MPVIGIINHEMRVRLSPEGRYLTSLGVASVVNAGLVVVGSFQVGESAYSYLIWNLFLAWIPLVLALWLVNVLRRKLWSSWTAICLTIAWLALLPNSFYMVSDLIHLAELAPSQVLYGAVIFTGFTLTGLCLGMTSLYLVHREFLKRVRSQAAAGLVGVLLLACSLAIYIGRDLRWNSWDVVFNPFGLLFDLSERLLHPSRYGQVLAVVAPFFVLLATIYYVVWQLAGTLQQAKVDKSY